MGVNNSIRFMSRSLIARSPIESVSFLTPPTGHLIKRSHEQTRPVLRTSPIGKPLPPSKEAFRTEPLFFNDDATERAFPLRLRDAAENCDLSHGGKPDKKNG
jgi:hypothetical protein